MAFITVPYLPQQFLFTQVLKISVPDASYFGTDLDADPRIRTSHQRIRKLQNFKIYSMIKLNFLARKFL
jgi:hypothetical protein